MQKKLILAAIACGVLAACEPALPPVPPIKESRWLQQNWKAGERFWYHHATQGTSTFPVPYTWFVALERPKLWLFGAPPLLIDQDYMQQFGFIPSPKTIGSGADKSYGYTADSYAASYLEAEYKQKVSEVNPDGLPVGLARTKAYTDPTTGAPVPDQIGLTCAACHTGHLEYNGVSLRIDGGTATVDLGKFRSAFSLALAYTKYVPFRFDRFAERVLGPNYTDAEYETLKTQFNQTLAGMKAVADAEATKPGKDLEEGFGRLDALTRIGNTVFAEDMVTAKAPGFNWLNNFERIVAPVKLPHIWDTSWFDWVQYDGSIMQPMVRNAGEALGVTAKVNVSNPERPLYASSVQVDTIHEMEMALAGSNPMTPDAAGKVKGFNGLLSPKWPEDVLGKIDQTQAQTGKGLYKELCQGCHLPAVTEPEFWHPSLWTTPNGAGQSYLKVPLVEIAKVGTDPAQATILTTRKVAVPAYLGVDPGTLCNGKPTGVVTETLFAFALGYVVEATTKAWYGSHQTPPAQQAEMNGYRPNCLQAELVYKARPLNGAWALAPYLHNGSVPTLDDLLQPAASRPKTFCVGNRSFDPDKVGLKTTCESGTVTIDTATAGNLNTGHEFRDGPLGKGVIGRALNANERKALIAYLKTQ